MRWIKLSVDHAKGTACMNDPEWATTRAESKANGALITHASNQILQPTAFSSVL